MTMLKPLVSIGAAAALAGTIALAYAQTTREEPAPAAATTSPATDASTAPSTAASPTLPSPAPGTPSGASPSTDATTTMSPPSGRDSGMTEMREPKPDRN